MIKDYYSLTKSGLVFGNIITVIGGFTLASRGAVINITTLLATIIGLSLVMASGCVINNYIDRDIDAKMARTRSRALVEGRISRTGALIFGTVLGVIGFAVLWITTNALTVGVAATGFVFYIVMYTLWWKRASVHGTIVGAISGATPPVVGYCAASNRFDAGAIILFAILLFWQMPHFFAIAIRRADDYRAAHIPVMPVKKGFHATKIAMVVYIALFTIAASALTIFGYAGYGYLAMALILGILWLALAIPGIWTSGNTADVRWARKLFFFSLIVLVVLFAVMTLGAIA